MKLSIVLVLVLLIAFPLSIEGAEWIPYATTEIGTELYLDKESINHESDYVIKVREKSKYGTPRKIANQSYFELWRYVELDCKEKRLRVLESTFFLVGGDTRTTTGRGKDEWVRIEPGGNNDVLHKTLCKDVLNDTVRQTTQ
jgi:hypothetical protein